MINYLNISGDISLEGSKSILNRVLIISSYLKKPIKIINPSNCNDVKTMADNLIKLGMKIDKSLDTWIILPPEKINRKVDLFIHDSGTAYRFLSAKTATIKNSKYIINISDQLKPRPIKPLIDILNKMGSKIEMKDDSLIIEGNILKGGIFNLSADISSQFISSLLLIAPTYENDLELVLKRNIVSRSYINMTIKIMQDFGIIANFDGKRIFIKAGQKYNELEEYIIEPDYSSACYFWALGALSKSVISTNSNNRTSLQPDYKFLTILENIGAKIEINKDKININNRKLKGISIDMKNMPDQVPTLAVLALFANSKTLITGIEHLKYKESNRIEAIKKELSSIGANILYENGELTINPLDKDPGNVTLNTYNDHRMIMAFYILKIVFPQISIANTSPVDKSYPNFLNDIKTLTV